MNIDSSVPSILRWGRDSPTLRESILIITLATLINHAYFIFVISVLVWQGRIPSIIGAFVGVVIGLIGEFLILLTIWLFCAASIHSIAWYGFTTDEITDVDIRATFAYVGYFLAPLIIGAIVATGTRTYTIIQVGIPEAELLQAYWGFVAFRPLVIAGDSIVSAIIVGIGILWIRLVQHRYVLSFRAGMLKVTPSVATLLIWVWIERVPYLL